MRKCRRKVQLLLRLRDSLIGIFIVGNKAGAYYRKGVNPVQYILQDCNQWEIF